MLTAFLAGSGSPVVIPDAVAVVQGRSEDEVHFVDAQGKSLVVFKRPDVSLFSADDAELAAIEAESGIKHPDPTQAGGSFSS